MARHNTRVKTIDTGFSPETAHLITQMLYVIKGTMRAAFVEENGGEGAVINDLEQGDVMFFPQGLIHYQQNLDCEPAAFIAALNHEDPGAVAIMTIFFDLPSEALQVISLLISGLL